jgi:glutaminyl-peptide cyclotransferase
MVFGMSDSSSSRFRQFLILNFSFVIGLSSCSPSYKADVDAMVLQPAVEFNADSAYFQIANQVNFGPRIPGTDTHTQCGNYLVETLNRYGAQVMEQRDSVTVAAASAYQCATLSGHFLQKRKSGFC